MTKLRLLTRNLLDDLKKLTAEADYEKALAVLAKGLGKTYLATFFAENYQRVLLIACTWP